MRERTLEVVGRVTFKKEPLASKIMKQKPNIALDDEFKNYCNLVERMLEVDPK